MPCAKTTDNQTETNCSAKYEWAIDWRLEYKSRIKRKSKISISNDALSLVFGTKEFLIKKYFGLIGIQNKVTSEHFTKWKLLFNANYELLTAERMTYNNIIGCEIGIFPKNGFISWNFSRWFFHLNEIEI